MIVENVFVHDDADSMEYHLPIVETHLKSSKVAQINMDALGITVLCPVSSVALISEFLFNCYNEKQFQKL